MDYSKLSDDEINNMVGNLVSQRFRTDYCNDPGAAWPIIRGNRIGIIPAPCAGEWKAAHRDVGDDGTPRHFTRHINPLRAAMIVFLMMQESQHA
ncbi:phage protein NinX family protein [Cronobacter malonaticus]